jgi:sirohydrochlorin cobaltochelatase
MSDQRSESASPCAYFLIAHGSRDERSHHALEACAVLVRQHLMAHLPSPVSANPLVGTGILEFGDRPLWLQIADFAKAAAITGVRQVFLLPLFLAAGNHVLQDLPEEIDLAQSHLAQSHMGTDVSLTLCPLLGTHSKLSRLVQARMGEVPTCDRWILLAHGTRRLGGNQPIEALAVKLGAFSSYWATSPTLEEQIVALQELGAKRIGIAPYFLFAGRITDAIEEHIAQLQSQFTALDLCVTQPLNPSPLLAEFLLDRCVTAGALSQ